MPLTIATWNVNSIAARLPLVENWVRSQQPDVLCLQEIKCIDEKFPAASFEQLGYESVIFGQPTYNGVATLVKKELASSIEGVQRGYIGDAEDAQRRLLSLKVGGVQVINVYIPNGQAVGTDKYNFKLEWFGKLRNFFDSQCDPLQPLALCGDYNVAPDPLDVYDAAAFEGKVLYSLPERVALQRVKDWGLVDSFRQLYPDSVTYSWWDYRQAAFRRNMGLRIDHIYITPSLAQRCTEVVIDQEPRTRERPSDHAPVVATFEG